MKQSRIPRHINHGILAVCAGLVLGGIGLYLTFRTQALTATPRKTTDFLDSMGVIIHPSQPDYPEGPGILSKLNQLRIKHARLNSKTDTTDDGYVRGLQSAKLLGQNGIKLHFTIKAPETASPTLPDITASVDDRINYIINNGLGGATESIESFNEYDNSDDPNWSTTLKQQVAYLHANRSRLAPGTKVLGPSLVGFRLPTTGPIMATDANGNPIGNYFDYGSVHSYYAGQKPESTFGSMLPTAPVSQFNKYPGNLTLAKTFESRMLSYAYYLSKNKPVVLSETGYTNDVKGNYEGRIDEVSSGAYIPRVFIDTFRIGVLRTYLYELVDEPSTSTSRERHFGLYRSDGSPKPAATALKNMTTLLSGGSSSFTPTSLSYTPVSSSPLSTFLLQKKPGEYWLALWRPVSVYNEVTHQPLPQKSSSATITFPGQQRVTYYRDMSLTKDASVPTTAQKSFTLQVGPKVSLLKITQ